MRLFVAVKIPVQVQEKIAKELLSEIPQGGFAKVKPSNLHITLCFLGERSEDETKVIKAALQKIKETEFTVQLSGIGSFSENVIWVGVKEGTAELEGLAQKVHKSVFAQEEKFHAHLTLARNRGLEKKEFEKIVKKLSEKAFQEKFEVSTVSLMKSTLTPSGSVYEEISESTFCKSCSGS